MNQVSQENSSSSSSDDQQDSGPNPTAMPTGVSEEHFKKECKYNRYEDTKDGVAFQIHIRVCICTSGYEDRSSLIQDKMEFMPTDQEGTEIHFNPACKWRRRRVMRFGKTVYVLTKYCTGCTPPETNAPMLVMNRNSSSDEDQADIACAYGATPTGKTEEHWDRHCKYERVHDIIQGRNVYIHIRICKCGNYADRSDLLKGTMNLYKMDGKEIHFLPTCKWRRSKIGHKRYVLRACCSSCSDPQTTGATASAMNSVEQSLNCPLS